MRRTLAAFALVAFGGACCAPDSCRPARTGVAALEPVTARLLAYEAATGRLPPDLETAFPNGLPGLARRDAADQWIWYGYQPPQGEAVSFGYSAEHSGDVVEAGTNLRFGYTGPGRNWCYWSAQTPEWSCWGYM